MTIDKIKAAYEARPFVPFTIHLADGRTLRVEHPEFMAMMPGGRAIIVVLDDDSWQVVDLLLVVSLGFGSKDSKRKPRKRSA